MAYKKLFCFKSYIRMAYLQASEWSEFQWDVSSKGMNPYWLNASSDCDYRVSSDTPHDVLFTWMCKYITCSSSDATSGAEAHPLERQLHYYRAAYKALRSWYEHQLDQPKTAHGGHFQGEMR